MMGSFIEENKKQIERNSTKRRYAVVCEVPNSSPLYAGSSETESDNIPMMLLNEGRNQRLRRLYLKRVTSQ